jgi:hypothetical protein
MRGRWIALAAIGTAGAAAALGSYRRVIRPWYERWGVDPGDEDRLLPGDELIGAPTGGDTRGITIEAPAAAIWPWLVQMGFGRAGWYSYDTLDQRGSSAEAIVPAWQGIAVGDVLPTWPGGGFEVAQIETDHALVLYLDDEIVDRQSDEARATAVGGVGTDPTPVGLAASSAIMRTQPRRFRVSWAFVLEPLGGDRTRLIERVRVEYPEMNAWNHVTGPMLGVGVFLMTRRQMLGIKQRAERLVRDQRRTSIRIEVVPAPRAEVMPEPEKPVEPEALPEPESVLEPDPVVDPEPVLQSERVLEPDEAPVPVVESAAGGRDKAHKRDRRPA